MKEKTHRQLSWLTEAMMNFDHDLADLLYDIMSGECEMEKEDLFNLINYKMNVYGIFKTRRIVVGAYYCHVTGTMLPIFEGSDGKPVMGTPKDIEIQEKWSEIKLPWPRFYPHVPEERGPEEI